MPHGGAVLTALTVAIFVTTAIAVFALVNMIWAGEQARSMVRAMNRVAAREQDAKAPERRRSERSLNRAYVFAYSHPPGQSPFHEEATTLDVSPHGGLLLLAADVFVGQKLLLTNVANQHERECYVVAIRSSAASEEKR